MEVFVMNTRIGIFWYGLPDMHFLEAKKCIITKASESGYDLLQMDEGFCPFEKCRSVIFMCKHSVLPALLKMAASKNVQKAGIFEGSLGSARDIKQNFEDGEMEIITSVNPEELVASLIR
jgi:hypothetical protein